MSERRVIVCTTGTSLIGNLGLRDVDDSQLDMATGNALRERLADTDDPTAVGAELCAEAKSLRALQADEEDLVYLLHTDTMRGEISSKHVERVLERCLNLASESIRIEGLQVEDAATFRKWGVQNLYKALEKLERKNPECELVLNVTGGFKSVVPYMTLYGMLNALQVVYIFQRSDELLKLPPAPVTVDFEKASHMLPLIERIRQEGGIPLSDFEAGISHIPYHERGWFRTLVEVDGDFLTLSAFGQMVAAAADESSATSVRLSKNARDSYESSSGNVRKMFDGMLSRIRNPMWRKSAMDAGWARHTDLKVAKPGNVAERAAYYLKGTDVYVCELYPDHDKYEKHLPNRKISDYSSEQFVVWSPPADVPELPAEEPPDKGGAGEKRILEARVSELSGERKRLREQIADLETKLSEERSRAAALEELKIRSISLETKLKNTERLAEDLERKKTELETRLSEASEQLQESLDRQRGLSDDIGRLKSELSGGRGADRDSILDRCQGLMRDRMKKLLELEEKDSAGAAEYYYSEILPKSLVLARQAWEQSPDFIEDVDLLISMVGMSPATTIEAFACLRPSRVHVISSERSSVVVDRFREYIVESNGSNENGYRIPLSAFSRDICDHMDPNDISDTIEYGIRQFARPGERIVIDMTGGTKPMSSAAANGAWRFGTGLCYVNGEYCRNRRTPIPGTERLYMLVNPLESSMTFEKRAASVLFESGDYAAAAESYNRIAEKALRPGVARFMRCLSGLYHAWSLMDIEALSEKAEELHELLQVEAEPVGRLSREERSRLVKQADFCIGLAGDPENLAPLGHYAAGCSLLESGRYELGAVNLYRAIEKAIALRLEKRWKLDTSDPDYDALECELEEVEKTYLDLSGRFSSERGVAVDSLPARIGIFNGAMLLAALEDEMMGKAGLSDSEGLGELQKALAVRNASTIGHGLGRVGRKALGMRKVAGRFVTAMGESMPSGSSISVWLSAGKYLQFINLQEVLQR